MGRRQNAGAPEFFVLVDKTRELGTVSTRGCPFKGRNARPVICPEGWECVCLLAW